jgi:hypothetical protein
MSDQQIRKCPLTVNRNEKAATVKNV